MLVGLNLEKSDCSGAAAGVQGACEVAAVEAEPGRGLLRPVLQQSCCVGGG